MSKVIWVIILILIIIAGFFIFRDGDGTEDNLNEDQTEEASTIEDLSDSEFSELENSNDVFDEIDSTLEFIE